MLLALEVLLFSYCLWLGCYLLARNSADWRLRYAGLGLVAYAAALAGMVLAPDAPFTRPLLYLPPVFWFGAIVSLFPPEVITARRMAPLLDYMLPLVALIIYLLGWGTALVGQGEWLVANLVVLALLASGAAAVWQWRQQDKPADTERQVRLWTVVVTIFFAIGAGGLVLPLQIDWLPPIWILLALGLDLEILGLAIVWLDAYEQGEAMRRDVVRSLIYTFAAVLFFGGQVVGVMWWQGVSLPLIALLLTVIATAVVTQTFGNQLSVILDRLIFIQSPQVQQARAQLREAETAVSRRDESLDLLRVEEKEFSRLTRRALSHMGDLPKLSSSPLTRLPVVSQRLEAKADEQIGGDTLARAAILRALLVESIGRLRPLGETDFATTDEWRFYNAVYFPYVAGLKPYSRRAFHMDLGQNEREALTWFQQQVPERTLYNWQKKAAELIGRDLREQVLGEG